jgi:predicted DsbA family dithiol-disulfide isomerase
MPDEPMRDELTREALTPPPGTIVIFSDIWCAFGHLAVYRLHDARQRLGLRNEVRFDHRAFPMELLNGNPGSRPGSDSEVPTVGACEPNAGWQLWQAKDWLYPSSSLPALEAVQAAKQQSVEASEDLDLALRRAFWSESRCINNQRVILDVADTVPTVDTDDLRSALTYGTARAQVADHARQSQSPHVLCSPHVFLPDGSDVANPGLDVEWVGDWGKGYPHIVEDDPSIYQRILRRAVPAAT